VGGQGILFITRLMAEAAIVKGLPVLTSETHGMAQRGGTVISHLKVGDFSSPLVRPSSADGMLVLQSSNVLQHGYYVKPGAWMVINGECDAAREHAAQEFTIDATGCAREIGNPRSANLILLGFTIGRTLQLPDTAKRLFCSPEDIQCVLEQRFAKRKELLGASINALETGYNFKLKADR